MIARLKPGATLAQAQAQIDAQNNILEADDPRAQDDSRGRFSFRGGAPSRGPSSNNPPHPVVDAGGRDGSIADRRGKPDEPSLYPGERPFEGNRHPAGVRRGRLHIISEAVVETTPLTLARGLLGLAAGAGGIRLLGVLAVDRLPLGRHIAIDYRLACVAVLGAVVMGLALAAPIAWFNLRGIGKRRPIGDPRRNRHAPLKAYATPLSWRRSRWPRSC